MTSSNNYSKYKYEIITTICALYSIKYNYFKLFLIYLK